MFQYNMSEGHLELAVLCRPLLKAQAPLLHSIHLLQQLGSRLVATLSQRPLTTRMRITVFIIIIAAVFSTKGIYALDSTIYLRTAKNNYFGNCPVIIYGTPFATKFRQNVIGVCI